MRFSFLTQKWGSETLSYTAILKLFVVSLLLAFLLFMPDAVYFIRNGMFSYLLLGLLIVWLLLCIPVVLFCRILKVYYIFLCLFATFSPLALLPILLVNNQLNQEMIMLAITSNSKEAFELLGLQFVFLLLACVLFLWLSSKLANRLPTQISFQKGLAISIFACLIFLLLPFFKSTDTRYYQPLLKNLGYSYYPYRLGKIIPLIVEEQNRKSNYIEKTRNFSFEVKNNAPLSPTIHVLVIGETARADHFSLNGYSRQTNPYLSKQEGFFSFLNVVSGGTVTEVSVPLLITRADPHHINRQYEERSIAEAFKEAGYQTAWISNQAKHSLTSTISMHYPDFDTTIFHNSGTAESIVTGTSDSVMLPTIDQYIQNHKNQSLLLVIHTLGSHWRFHLRYPSSFNKFRPGTNGQYPLVGFPPKSQIVNDYDNSILFTDYFLNQVIEQLKKTGMPSTLTYVSDHGENLGDDERNLYFHTHVPTRATARVPLFLWLSNRYRQQHPIIERHLKSNITKPISSAESIFHSILTLADIRIKQHDSTLSYASPFFKSSPQVIVGEEKKLYRFSDIK